MPFLRQDTLFLFYNSSMAVYFFYGEEDFNIDIEQFPPKKQEKTDTEKTDLPNTLV